jgi:histidine ammonia-lyase
MSDYSDHEVLATYAQQTEQQIIDLNRTIVALRSKIALLEQELEERNKIPVPRTVQMQFIEQEAKIRKLEDDLKFYKKHVNPQIIINRENKEKPARSGGLPK